jgi:hypothetical protein
MHPMHPMHPIANPGAYAEEHHFLLWFGAYGGTRLHVFTMSACLYQALELAAEWLVENEPGHLSTEEEVRSNFDAEELAQFEVEGMSYPDMTYTEAGWLASYEWTGHEYEPHHSAEPAEAVRERAKLLSAEPMWVTMSCCLNLPDTDDQGEYVKAQLLDIVNATPSDELPNLLVDTIGPLMQESYKEQLRADLTRRIGYHDGLCMDNPIDVRQLVDVVLLALFD